MRLWFGRGDEDNRLWSEYAGCCFLDGNRPSCGVRLVALQAGRGSLLWSTCDEGTAGARLEHSTENADGVVRLVSHEKRYVAQAVDMSMQ